LPIYQAEVYLVSKEISSQLPDPPAQWIREKRLLKSKRIIHNTALSVTDICYTAGFENVAHFSKLYKDFFVIPHL